MVLTVVCACMETCIYVHLVANELTYRGNREEEDGMNVEADGGESIILVLCHLKAALCLQPTHVHHIC